MVLHHFAYIDPPGVAPDERQDLLSDQAVVHDHVGLAEQAMGAQRQKIGCSWTGTNQKHGPDRVLLRRVALTFSLHLAQCRRIISCKYQFDDAAGVEPFEQVSPSRCIRPGAGTRLLAS